MGHDFPKADADSVRLFEHVSNIDMTAILLLLVIRFFTFTKQVSYVESFETVMTNHCSF